MFVKSFCWYAASFRIALFVRYGYYDYIYFGWWLWRFGEVDYFFRITMSSRVVVGV